MGRKEKKLVNNSILRNSKLMESRTAKMATPYIFSTLSVALVSAINSLIAGRNIGAVALAAVAATAPFFSIEQILDYFLAYGIDKLMIQEVGKGNRKAANRIFGSILVAVTAAYVLVFGLIILFERPILSLIGIDPTLHDAVVAYSLPLLITMPLVEICHCIERAFRVDGRARLFASRGIVTNIVNISLSILFVTVLGFDIEGLAWASVIGTFLGYGVTLSHFFSKKRTVSPDFTVLFSVKENFRYIKDSIRVGSSVTFDEVLYGLLVLIQTNVVSTIGGTTGLAVWGVFTTLENVIVSIYFGVSASVSLHSGLMIGQKNYAGARASLMKGFALLASFGFAATILLFFFPSQIASAFCTDPGIIPLCVSCLQIGSFFLPSEAMTIVLSGYLPAVNKSRVAFGMTILQKGGLIVATIIGYVVGFNGMLISLVVAGWIITIIQNMLVFVKGNLFVPEHNPEVFRSYSIQLSGQSISRVCDDIVAADELTRYGKDYSERVAMIVEESMKQLLEQTKGKKIMTDIDLGKQDDGVFIRFVDDGAAYNLLADMDSRDIKDDLLEEAIKRGLLKNATYDRVIDLNLITVTVGYPE